jgi:hypothetical protein
MTTVSNPKRNPAERLHGDDATFLQRGAVGAKYERLDCLVVDRQAIDRQVRPGLAARASLAFDFPHALEQRHFAVVVVINPHAEIDLVRIAVGDERLGDAEDGVARCKLERSQGGG